MSRRHPDRHGYAAFDRADIEDARRRRPPAALDGYAAERGLEFRDRALLAGFRSASPPFPEQQFNLMRGMLPGGRFGVLFHELLKTHGPGVSMPGVFHSVSTSSTEGFWRSMIPDRTDIPFLGAFLDAKEDTSPGFAFEGQGAWSPVTTVGVPVPETVSRIDRLVLTVAHRTPAFDTSASRHLDALGAPGWRAAATPEIEPDRLRELLSAPTRAALASLSGLPFAQVRIDHGMVTVRRNGYLMEPAELDRFAETASRLADGLAAACLGGRSQARFEDPLPPCPWETGRSDVVHQGLPKAWEEDFRGYAARHGLTLEDPAAWHERFASVPVPGRALAVMRTPAGLRVLFTTEVPVGGPRAVRGCVAFPVSPSTAPTPPGGRLSAQTQTTAAVHEGVGVVWTHRLFGYASEADGLVETALAAGAQAGVEPQWSGRSSEEEPPS